MKEKISLFTERYGNGIIAVSSIFLITILTGVLITATGKMLVLEYDGLSGGTDDTNEKQTFGAGAILYENMYKKLERIVGDFIVIPSSVHEVIIIPSMYESPYISNLIREVNETTVRADEVLSDRPYKLTPAGELIAI